MANETLSTEIVPCGGAVYVQYGSSDPGTWTLTRSVVASGVATQQIILNAMPAPAGGAGFFLDIGDGTNAPLSQRTEYTYVISTATGSASGTVIPANEIELAYDDYTLILFRLLQSAIAVLKYPSGLQLPQPPTVLYAMPITSAPALPIVTLSEVLMQQWLVKIGPATNPTIFENSYISAQQVKRRYLVTVAATTPQVRDFLKYAVLGIFTTIFTPVLARLGQDVEHSFQAASNQKIDPAPGFYYCDISLDFSGVFATKVLTDFPIVETFVPLDLG